MSGKMTLNKEESVTILSRNIPASANLPNKKSNNNII